VSKWVLHGCVHGGVTLRGEFLRAFVCKFMGVFMGEFVGAFMGE